MFFVCVSYLCDDDDDDEMMRYIAIYIHVCGGCVYIWIEARKYRRGEI